MEAITTTQMTYEEANAKMRAGKFVKRAGWPAGYHCSLGAFNGAETLMIHQTGRSREVPLTIHALDLGASDWIEVTP